MEKMLFWLSRRLLIILTAALVILAVWSYFYHVPQFVQARCVITSEGRMTPVFSPESGYIVQTINQTGKMVKKGAPLLEISSQEGKSTVVHSSASGYLQQVKNIEPTSGVLKINKGNLIGYIIEPNPLSIEASIESSQISSLKLGMKAFIRLDPFPYQKHGLIEAEVQDISDIPSTYTKEGIPLYQVKIKPKAIPEELEKNFKHGLEGDLQIVTGDKRLLSYILPFLLNSREHS